MPSSTCPSLSPSACPANSTARQHILIANIHISTLTLIAALLLTLMLLWHISTITLVENYMMPDWWGKAFLAEHANGWRVGVWVLISVLVPVDCLHALLCLDWWCAVSHGRGRDNETAREEEGSLKGSMDDEKAISAAMHKHVEDWGREQHNHEIHTATTSQPSSYTSAMINSKAISTPIDQPYTHHPLLHRHLSTPTQNLILSILDILMIAVLAAHVITYFVSLPTAIAFCNLPAVLLHPKLEFGATKVPLSMRNRCVGLNVDIHVAGGFAVFMAIVLGLLHLVALVVRIWEYVCYGRDGVAGQRARKLGAGSVGDGVSAYSSTIVSSGRTMSTSGETRNESSSSRSGNTTSALESRDVTSVSAEERSTGIRSIDWNAERTQQTARRRAVQTDESEALMGTAMWSEIFLECLIDA